jgi:hypothetical protein
VVGSGSTFLGCVVSGVEFTDSEKMEIERERFFSVALKASKQ